MIYLWGALGLVGCLLVGLVGTALAEGLWEAVFGKHVDTARVVVLWLFTIALAGSGAVLAIVGHGQSSQLGWVLLAFSLVMLAFAVAQMLGNRRERPRAHDPQRTAPRRSIDRG